MKRGRLFQPRLLQDGKLRFLRQLFRVKRNGYFPFFGRMYVMPVGSHLVFQHPTIRKDQSLHILRRHWHVVTSLHHYIITKHVLIQYVFLQRVFDAQATIFYAVWLLMINVSGKVTDNTMQQMNQLPDVVCEGQNSLKWISRTGLLVSHRVRLVESLE